MRLFVHMKFFQFFLLAKANPQMHAENSANAGGVAPFRNYKNNRKRYSWIRNWNKSRSSVPSIDIINWQKKAWSDRDFHFEQTIKTLSWQKSFETESFPPSVHFNALSSSPLLLRDSKSSTVPVLRVYSYYSRISLPCTGSLRIPYLFVSGAWTRATTSLT